MKRTPSGVAVVYFIEAVGQGLVKIGTTNDLRQRFCGLWTTSPVELRVLRVEVGGRDYERRLHERFDEHRSHGEWFRIEGALAEFLQVATAAQFREPPESTRPESPPTGLTDEFIRTLRPQTQAYEAPDKTWRGLVLRVLPTGTKVFRWYVRSMNKVVTIGPWTDQQQSGYVTLDEARAWLKALKEARKAGHDALVRAEAEMHKQVGQPMMVAAVG